MSNLTEEHRAIEAVLLCAVEPVTSGLLAELIEIPAEQIEMLCSELASDYLDQRRGFQLVRIAGGYRLQTDPSLAEFHRALREPRASRRACLRRRSRPSPSSHTASRSLVPRWLRFAA